MHDVRPAILLPERNVGSARVEKENVLSRGPVRELHECGGRGVDDDEIVLRLVEFLQRLQSLFRRADGLGMERVKIADQLAAGIVLLDGHLRTGDPGITGLDIQPGGRPRLFVILADVADRNRPEIGGLAQLQFDATLGPRLRCGPLWSVRRRAGERI
jgi:hypothetical protein